VSLPFPEPTTVVPSRAEVFLGYLDYFRSRLVSKLEALPDGELRVSRLPSNWTPIELLRHLVFAYCLPMAAGDAELCCPAVSPAGGYGSGGVGEVLRPSAGRQAAVVP
jgi:hypothetical protein